MWNYIIGALVLLAIGFAVWRIVKGCEKGGNCGCGCGSCAAKDVCEKDK
ncbi:hypothetical protein FACS18949_00460 [Clostridia bacterium]|nr:hypothetical protein FACS189425_00630 [Clostridia bacterium]GHV31604.1 hypothetical protein FACS18949_00460 [Clostridia bacterium]